MNFDVNLVGAILGILSAVLSAFVAVSRYTSNLRLNIQELKHENVLLRRDTASAIRQLRHTCSIQKKQIEDLEKALQLNLNFQPRHPIGYETDASWLKDS